VNDSLEVQVLYPALYGGEGLAKRKGCTVEKDASVPVDDLYSAFKDWCEDNERKKLDKSHFGIDMRAAFPAVTKTRTGRGQERVNIYAGIKLGVIEQAADAPPSDHSADPLADEEAASPRYTTTMGHEVGNPLPYGTECEKCGSPRGVVYRIRQKDGTRTGRLHEGCADAVFGAAP
jgi:hypothetical protein